MMTIRSMFMAIIAICLGALAAATAFAGSPQDDVKNAYAAWDAAFNKTDAKAIAALYADDAILLPPTHNVIKGPAGVEKFFSGVLAMGATGHKLELIEAHGDGNLLFGAAKWSANGKDANGKDQPWGGLTTGIFERQSDGSLKIKLHTFN
jgi:ketosteroid isomerase-like protein